MRCFRDDSRYKVRCQAQILEQDREVKPWGLQLFQGSSGFVVNEGHYSKNRRAQCWHFDRLFGRFLHFSPLQSSRLLPQVRHMTRRRQTRLLGQNHPPNRSVRARWCAGFRVVPIPRPSVSNWVESGHFLLGMIRCTGLRSRWLQVLLEREPRVIAPRVPPHG